MMFVYPLAYKLFFDYFNWLLIGNVNVVNIHLVNHTVNIHLNSKLTFYNHRYTVLIWKRKINKNTKMLTAYRENLSLEICVVDLGFFVLDYVRSFFSSDETIAYLENGINGNSPDFRAFALTKFEILHEHCVLGKWAEPFKAH